MRCFLTMCCSVFLVNTSGCNRVVSVKKDWSAYLGPATTVMDLQLWPSDDHRREHLFVNEDFYLGERSPLDWNAQDDIYPVGDLIAGTHVQVVDIRAVKYLLGNVRDSRKTFYYVFESIDENSGETIRASTRFRYLEFEEAP